MQFIKIKKAKWYMYLPYIKCVRRDQRTRPDQTTSHEGISWWMITTNDNNNNIVLNMYTGCIKKTKLSILITSGLQGISKGEKRCKKMFGICNFWKRCGYTALHQRYLLDWIELCAIAAGFLGCIFLPKWVPGLALKTKGIFPLVNSVVRWDDI